MFRRGKRRGKATGAIATLLGEGSKFKGTLIAQGAIRIDGEVQGSIVAQGSLIIGQTGVIKADVEAQDVIVGGKVTGNVIARNRLEILSSGQLYGDVKTPNLTIAEGVIFQGVCDMGEKVAETEEAPEPEGSEKTEASKPVATPEEPLQNVPGVGLATARKLKGAGYMTIRDLARARPTEMAPALNITRALAENLIVAARRKVIEMARGKS